MKKITIVGVLLLCLLLAGITACSELSGNKEAAAEPIKVERGDITVGVRGSGNIEVFKDAKLTFGVGGRIEKIYVEEGDEVSRGDVIAKLDTDALVLAVSQAEVAVTKAETDITQAEVALKTAEYNLEQSQSSYTLEDINDARANIIIAQRDLDAVLFTLSKYEEGTPGYTEYQEIVIFAQARLKAAQDRYDAILTGNDSKEVAIKRLQVDLAIQTMELANQSLTLAQSSLSQAGNQLNDATITAPFDGVVASVYADEDDTVSTMNQIVYIIDPSMMELKVDVDEIDIADVTPGQKAKIEVDALPDLELEGEVSSISQLPKEEGGVIVYEVKVRFDVDEGSGLRDGMSASVDIIVTEKAGVLMVPSRAIKTNSDGNSIVEIVMDNGENKERVVTTGISDGFMIEIVSGLQDGETILSR